MRTAESVLATAGPAARRHLAGAGLLVLRWIGSTVQNASVIALVMLLADAMDRGRRLVPPDPGNRLRWILLAGGVWAFLVLGEELITRRKQVGSDADAT